MMLRFTIFLTLVSLCAGCGAAIESQVSSDPVVRGNKALSQGRVDTAIREFKLGMKQQPDNVDAWNGLGQAFERKGDYDRAITVFESAVKRFRKNGLGWYRLGRLYYAKGNYKGAQVALRKALLHDVKSPQVSLLTARCELQLERPEAALDVIKRHIAKHKVSSEALFVRGLAYSAVNKVASAKKDLSESARLAPRDARPLVALGTIHEAHDNLAGATRAYKAAVKRQGELVSGLIGLGRVLIQSGHAVDALPFLKRAARIDPQNIAVHNNLGVALSTVGLTKEAIEAFRGALDLDNRPASIHSNMAEAMYREGRLTGAERHLRLALSRASARPLDLAALRRVVIMRSVITHQCEAPSGDSSALKKRLGEAWEKEGWSGAYTDGLAAVHADKEAMRMINAAVQKCTKAPQ